MATLLKRVFPAALLALGVISNNEVLAQVNPLLNQYFNNNYLANASRAGDEKGLQVAVALHSQWSNIPEAPMMQNATLTYGAEKVGLGLNITADKAALQRQIRVVGTYAYHLPLNNGIDKLHFGVSVGFIGQRIATEDIVGDYSDVQVSAYNNRGIYVDGDFGMAYDRKAFSVGVSIVNISSFWRDSDLKLANVPVLYGDLSYRFKFDDISLTPKIAYRAFTGHSDIVDAGVQIGLIDNKLQFTSLYYSSKAASFAFGVNLQKKYLINAAYTTQTNTLNRYINGGYEVGIVLKL